MKKAISTLFMKKNSKFFKYFTKRKLAFSYAFRGLFLITKDAHTRIHLMATFVVISLSWFFNISSHEFIAIILCIVLVLSLEAINTALEKIVDLVSPAYHDLARDAKDIAAGAVLIGALGAACVGVYVFFPKLWSLFVSS